MNDEERVNKSVGPLRLVVAGAAAAAAIIHASVVAPNIGRGVAGQLLAFAAVVGIASAIAIVTGTSRRILMAVAVSHAVMLAVWMLSRTSGVPSVVGLRTAVPMGFSDAIAALCLAAVTAGGVWLMARPANTAVSESLSRATAVPVIAAVAVLGGPAAYVGASASRQSVGPIAAPKILGEHAGHAASAAAKPGLTTRDGKAFDPNANVDLSGTEDVTLVQQKQAELLVAQTLQDLPQFRDREYAISQGYQSIGDAATGDERLIKLDAINDGRILDPKAPEGLVYDMRSGVPKLEAAMFLLPDGSTLANVPDLGGKLVPWRMSDDLCVGGQSMPADPGGKTVGGSCPPGSGRVTPRPIVHVWIQPNRCGPFAALQGVSAGQVPSGPGDCGQVQGGASTPPTTRGSRPN